MDEDILDLIRAGRPDEAIARLVPAYRRRVFGLAYGILRVAPRPRTWPRRCS